MSVPEAVSRYNVRDLFSLLSHEQRVLLEKVREVLIGEPEIFDRPLLVDAIDG